MLFSKANSLHIFSKTLKNIATDRYIFLFVLSVPRSVVFPSKSFNFFASKTFYRRSSIAKCTAFTKIVTILPQSVEFLIAIRTCNSSILAEVLYQNQKLVDLIGDVNCPNKKWRGEKCVYLARFKEINKSTYECEQCRACCHALNNLFKDQKLCVTFFGWTY